MASLAPPLSYPLRRLLPLVIFALAAFFATVPARAATATEEVQTSWRLLDYIAVDYREAVTGGRVVNPAEYREMVEFSASVSEKLALLPAKPVRARLIADAGQLRSAIAAKAPQDEIAN